MKQLPAKKATALMVTHQHSSSARRRQTKRLHRGRERRFKSNTPTQLTQEKEE